MTEGERGYHPLGALAPPGKGKRPIAKRALTFAVHAATHRGKVRPTNQDAYLIANLETGERLARGAAVTCRPGEAGVLCVVSDGMGGARAGEVASRLSVTALLEALLRKEEAEGPPEARLRATIRAANAAVFARASRDENCAGMGTTLTALWLRADGVFVGHVGDSRAYLFHRGSLRQLTRDHTLVNFLLDCGYLTPESAERAGGRNVILEAVGVKPDVAVDTGAVRVEPGDRLLLCSDGLYSVLKDGELADLLGAECEPAALAARLVAEANRRGGPDNVTVVVCRVQAAA